MPLVLRDRRPLAAWRASLALLPAGLWVSFELGIDYEDNPYTPEMVLSYLLVAYSVAVRCDRRITGAAWVISVLVMWIAFPNGMPLGSVIVGAVMLLGYNVRVRRSATERLALEERRSQEAMGAQAVLEERARIARELHDVVAHHMSVIAIQAEAVPLKAAGDPAQLEAGLARASARCRWRRSPSSGRCSACCATRRAAPTPPRSPAWSRWTTWWPTRGRPGCPCWSGGPSRWRGCHRRWACPPTGSCRSR
ncbi:sensor histidine kinase [Nonomuraea ferruginea]